VFHRNGKPIKSFLRAWLSACRRAGLTVPVERDEKTVMVANSIPHDFRPTAVRNLERAGISRPAAISMIGHETESIYRRYAIVDSQMLNEAGAKLQNSTTSRCGMMPGTRLRWRSTRPALSEASEANGASSLHVELFERCCRKPLLGSPQQD